MPAEVEIGSVHLAGAGAIGEMVAETLRASQVRGELIIVDPQSVEESNLQRYVLALDDDVGVSKTTLVARALVDSGVRVVEVGSHWGEDDRSTPGQAVVLSALDTAEDRIGVQAGLHQRIYNAFTQPEDLGWSRHEAFGEAPCLACLYWPTGRRLHRHELVAKALRQPLLRVRAYLASGEVAGRPLPQSFPIPMVESPPRPEEIELWMRRPILEDIAEALGIEEGALDRWADRPIDDLYREGICGGAILRVRREEGSRDMLVPLAHQSALAGVMLAVQLLAGSNEELRERRPDEIEGRFNVLRPIPQTIPIPGSRARDCICSDPYFLEAWTRGDRSHLTKAGQE